MSKQRMKETFFLRNLFSKTKHIVLKISKILSRLYFALIIKIISISVFTSTLENMTTQNSSWKLTNMETILQNAIYGVLSVCQRILRELRTSLNVQYNNFGLFQVQKLSKFLKCGFRGNFWCIWFGKTWFVIIFIIIIIIVVTIIIIINIGIIICIIICMSYFVQCLAGWSF